jgi:predicted aspartyl protease
LGRTTVEAFAIGPNGTRRFDFLVDTGSTYVGLPLDDIEALGLPTFPGGRHKVMTPTGVIEQETYSGAIELEEYGTAALVSECPVPFIGVEVLERLGMKVNPVTQKLEKAGEDEDVPYMTLRL